MAEKKLPPPEECANCGAAIPRHASACPECGADERTGWRETSVYDGMDLPDSAWEDDDAKPAKKPKQEKINGIAWYWWCVGLMLILVIVSRGLRLW